MAKKYKGIAWGLGVVVVLLLTMYTSRLNIQAEQINNSNTHYRASIEQVRSAMNHKYESSTEEIKVENFAAFYEGIASIETSYPYTSYYDEETEDLLERMIDELGVYFKRHWLEDFVNYEEDMIEVYNLLYEVAQYPATSESIEAVLTYLEAYNK